MKPCFEFLQRSHVLHEGVYPDSLLWWINHYRERLVADRLWDWCLKQISETLDVLTSSFELFELSEEECRKIGRNFDYSEGAYNSGTICDLIDELTIYDDYEPLVWQFLELLESSEDQAKIRWYVELAFHSRIWCLLYEDDALPYENFERKEAVFHRLHSFQMYQKKSDIATDLAAQEGRFKYNRLVSLF